MQTKDILHKIVDTFTIETENNERIVTVNFLKNVYANNNIDFEITTCEVDTKEHYNLSNIFTSDIETVENKENLPADLVLNRASARIAKKTRRAMAKNYAMIAPTMALLWYKGTTSYDAPLIKVGNNVAFNKNCADYFCLVENVVLKDEAVLNLEDMGFIRIA